MRACGAKERREKVICGYIFLAFDINGIFFHAQSERPVPAAVILSDTHFPLVSLA